MQDCFLISQSNLLYSPMQSAHTAAQAPWAMTLEVLCHYPLLSSRQSSHKNLYGIIIHSPPVKQINDVYAMFAYSYTLFNA